MATTSATSTISSLGVGSGIDANSIVTQLVALERQPISLLQTQASKLQTKISAYGQIQSQVSSLRDAAQKLTSPSLWAATTGSSADSSTVSVSTSDGAASGSYAVNVNSLAAAQSIVANTSLASSASTVGSGTLTFDVGKWTGNAFAAKTGSTSVSITIAATDTLAGIRDKINSANAGVTASIINDASGARLVMNSSTTGDVNGFRVTATDDDGNNTDNAGLSSLAYNPAAGTAGTTQTQAGANASATINGVSVSSTSNTFSNVLTGISLTVSKLTSAGAPVNVTVGQDNATIQKAITDFATAYSNLATYLRNNTKYDDSTKTAGTLQGDSLAVGTLNQFRSLAGSGSGTSSVFGTLSSAGLELQQDGTLKVNSTKLTSSLSNLTELKNLFSNSTTGSEGIAVKIRMTADNMLGIDGSITTRTAGLNSTIANNQKRQDDLDARAALYEKRLRAQYTALDTTMAGISSQGNYVTQMITQMNKA